MRLHRRRLIVTLMSLSIASLAITPGVHAATPPDIAADDATVTAQEGAVATTAGSFTEADGDTVTLSASIGAIVVDPDDSSRWIWTFTTTDGPGDSATVTVTATDVDGHDDATFDLVVTNKAPVASTDGPAFVPIASASDRIFSWAATDVAADTVTPTVDCGTGTITDLAADTIRCTFPLGGTIPVGVQATDEDGGSTDGRKTVRATAHVASVADATVLVNGAAGNDQMGGALGTPDLNDDGKADLAIGGTTTSTGAPTDPGYVMVVFGRATFATIDLGSLSGTAGFRIDGPAGTGFGRALANAGDINGDGRDDLLIGAEGAAGGKGAVYVVFGSTSITDLDVTTMTGAQGATITGAAAGSATGHAVAGVGDVNGDGKADIALGEPGLSGGDGGVDILFGGTSFTSVDLAALPGGRGIHVSDAGFSSGSSVAGGDVNGDGKSDVVIGSQLDSDSNATVIYGKASMADIDANPLSASNGFRIGGTEDLGITAVGAGDMDHDGFADVVIVHPDWDGGAQWHASIIRGAASNADIDVLATASRSRVLRIKSETDALGVDVSMGDADHDGRVDALIGAGPVGNNGEASGSAYLVRGAKTLTDLDFDVLTTQWRRIDGDNAAAFAGDAVAIADFSGNGVGDIIVGAPGSTAWGDASLPGRVGVLFGTMADLTRPTVTAPTPSIPKGRALVGSNPIVRISWTGKDTGSGIEHYQVQKKVDTGSWVTLPPTAIAAIDLALPTGHDYRFRVQAVDNVGNASAFKTGATFHLYGYQENSSKITYKGGWATATGSSYAGGATKYTGVKSRQATLTFTGRRVAFAAPTGPTRGEARLYIDGKFVKIISLFSATDQPTKVITWVSFSTSRTRTITIRVSGTVGHSRVDIDKFIVIR